MLEPNYREEKTAEIEKTMPREELVSCFAMPTESYKTVRSFEGGVG